MYVGVDLDATARAKGPRLRPMKPMPFDDLPTNRSAASTGSSTARRSRSFTPPSQRLTQPTKSQQRRKDIATDQGRVGITSGSQSARERPKSARSASPTGAPAAAGGPSTPSSPGNPSRLTPSYFGTPGSTSRSRPNTYTARVSAHSLTHSPSGRFHPDPQRRLEIRSADITANIDYYAPNGAPDNDRKMKEASWLSSQAFIESLRVYPNPNVPASPLLMPGEEIAFSGNTNSARRRHTEHVETAIRRRLSIAPPDSDWLPEQLPVKWPHNIPEGEWRSVGSYLTALSSSEGGTGVFGRLLKGGRPGTPSSRAAAAALAAVSSDMGSSRGPASPGAHMLFNR